MPILFGLSFAPFLFLMASLIQQYHHHLSIIFFKLQEHQRMSPEAHLYLICQVNWLLDFVGYCLPVPTRLTKRCVIKSATMHLNSLNDSYCSGLKMSQHITVVVPDNPLGHGEKLLIYINFHFHYFNFIFTLLFPFRCLVYIIYCARAQA